MTFNAYSLYASDISTESVNLDQYITNKTYTITHLGKDSSQLISESLVIQYKPHDLNNYFRKITCNKLYIASCDNNLENLEQYAGIDINSESGLFIESFSQINGYKVIYTSVGIDNLPHKFSGAVLVPESDKPLKGIVIFYHFTILDKQNIPSNFDRDMHRISKLLASTLASDGYAVVVPDYPGFGEDNKAVHPYLFYPEVNALSGINMVEVLKQMSFKIDYRLDNGKIPLFISGYSEGALYALWASKILQENPQFLNDNHVKLKKAVPISGPYNLSNVTLPSLLQVNEDNRPPYFIKNNLVTGYVKPALIANFLNSYSYYDLAENESAVFSDGFLICDGCVYNGNNYTISQLLQLPVMEMHKYGVFYQAAKHTGYSLWSNSAIPLVSPHLLENNKFKEIISGSDIYNWKSTIPVTLLTYEYDSIVSPLNTMTAYAAMTRSGSVSLKMITIPNQDFQVIGYFPATDIDVDHPQGIKFMLLFARKEFDKES